MDSGVLPDGEIPNNSEKPPELLTMADFDNAWNLEKIAPVHGKTDYDEMQRKWDLEYKGQEFVKRIMDLRGGYAATEVCSICIEEYPNILYKPCNHQCICSACDHDYFMSDVERHRCPICREKTEESIVVEESDVNLRDRDRAYMEKIQTEADAKRAVTEVKS